MLHKQTILRGIFSLTLCFLILSVFSFIHPASTASASAFSLQESYTITGTVTDKRGEPIAGANVLLKGSATGTVTNYKGKYSLTVPCEEGVLLFAFTKYRKQERSFIDTSTVIVTLRK